MYLLLYLVYIRVYITHQGIPISDFLSNQVRESQAAFDRQYEQTKILLTDADRKSDEFTCHLEEFVRSQVGSTFLSVFI